MTKMGEKYHWAKLEKLCFPQNEGGVGIRRIDDVVSAYAMKLWWRFRQNNNLWSNYMHDKFCAILHPIDCKIKPGISNLWKRLLEAREKTEPNILWLVGKGNIYAFKDRWCLAPLPLANSFQKLKIFFDANGQP